VSQNQQHSFSANPIRLAEHILREKGAVIGEYEQGVLDRLAAYCGEVINMPTLTWSTVRPTEAGKWYWYQRGLKPRIAYVYIFGRILYADFGPRKHPGEPMAVKEMKGRWCGPLEPPP
jgi:hypothetical protein